MRIWITGAKGLLGSCLAEMALPMICTGREVDIADSEAVTDFLSIHPDITHIVNCAAFSQVDPAEHHPEEAFRSNALGPEVLGKAARQASCRLVHISTDYVFSGREGRPLTETDPVEPLNMYGKTKLEGEKRLQNVFPEACILRTSWIFGKGGKNFVAKLLQMFQTEPIIRLTEDLWGRPTYAPDLARAIVSLLDQSGIYQFANEGIASKYTFGATMLQLARELKFPLPDCKLVPVPAALFPSSCTRPRYSVFDTTKIAPLLATPIRPWQEALREFLCTSL